MVQHELLISGLPVWACFIPAIAVNGAIACRRFRSPVSGVAGDSKRLREKVERNRAVLDIVADRSPRHAKAGAPAPDSMRAQLPNKPTLTQGCAEESLPKCRAAVAAMENLPPHARSCGCGGCGTSRRIRRLATPGTWHDAPPRPANEKNVRGRWEILDAASRYQCGARSARNEAAVHINVTLRRAAQPSRRSATGYTGRTRATADEGIRHPALPFLESAIHLAH